MKINRLKIFAALMFMDLFILWGFAFFVLTKLKPEINLPPETMKIVLIIFGIITACVIFANSYLKAAFLDEKFRIKAQNSDKTGQNGGSLLNTAQDQNKVKPETISFIILSLCNLPAVLALIAAILSGSMEYFYPFGIASMIMLAVYWPKNLEE